MQNDFLQPDSPLCVKGGLACLPNVIKSVEIARKSKIPVIWVIREHHPSGIDVEAFREKLYTDEKPGPVTPGSPGTALANGLSPIENEITIIKKRFSAFLFTNLDSILRRLDAKHVVLCGVQTPNCIRQTAFDAIGYDYGVTVLSDATASASQEIQDSNLRDMRNVGVLTPTVEEWAATVPAVEEKPSEGKPAVPEGTTEAE